MRHLAVWVQAQFIVLLQLRISSSTEAGSSTNAGTEGTRRRASNYYVESDRRTRDEAAELRRLERELERQDEESAPTRQLKRVPREGHVARSGARHHSRRQHGGSYTEAALDEEEVELARGSDKGAMDTAAAHADGHLHSHLPDERGEQTESRHRHVHVSGDGFSVQAEKSASLAENARLSGRGVTKEADLKRRHSVIRREESSHEHLPVAGPLASGHGSAILKAAHDGHDEDYSHESMEAAMAGIRKQQEDAAHATAGSLAEATKRPATISAAVAGDRHLKLPDGAIPAAALELSHTGGGKEMALHSTEVGTNAISGVELDSEKAKVEVASADSAAISEGHSADLSAQGQLEAALEAEAEDLSTHLQITTQVKVVAKAPEMEKFMMIKSESPRATCFLKCLEHNPLTNRLYVATCHRGPNQMWKLANEALVYEYDMKGARRCTDWMDWRKASRGLAFQISMPNFAFGFVATSWDDCRAKCFTLGTCKQAVFRKATRSCQLFKAKLDYDEDSLGGKNVEYVSTQCEEGNDQPKCLELVPNLGAVVMADCNSQVNQKWYMKDRQIVTRGENKCLVLKHQGQYGKPDNEAWNEVTVTGACDTSDSNQRWHWS